MTVSNAFSRPDSSAALREKILARRRSWATPGPTRPPAPFPTAPPERSESCSPEPPATHSRTISAVFPWGDRRGAGRGRVGADPAPARRALGTPYRSATSRWTGRSSTRAAHGAGSNGCAVGGCRWCSWTNHPAMTTPLSTSTTERVLARRPAHVVALGHRRIAVLNAGPATSVVSDAWFVPRQRMQGWRDALGPAGIAPVVLHLDRDVEDERVAAARELLTGPDRPTAVLCFSDSLAADVLRAAADLGVRVPDGALGGGLRRLARSRCASRPRSPP